MSGSLRDVCRSNADVYVLDASGFFAGFQLNVTGYVLTVPEVIDEVKDKESKRALEYSMEAGKVLVIKPKNESKDKVVDLARELGELGRLSHTDIELLALNKQLLEEGCRNVIVITDDHSVQNVALKLGVKVHGIKYRPLSKPKKYVYVCPICGFTSESPSTCPYCGVKLVRRYIKRLSPR
ncbi:MAG: hypothetical protein DRO18_02115 [Thermoprotei archaeon]|nr:MAG: hypothetical protein DRO18_02115 [Thermoprotei archaeon]